MNIKKELIKWSRYIRIFEIISKVCCAIILISFIHMVLFNMEIIVFSLHTYISFGVLMVEALFIGIHMKAIEGILNAVKENEDCIYKNELSYILLSEKDVIWAIICILFMILVILINSKLLYILWIIAIATLPNKIANYFKSKLSR